MSESSSPSASTGRRGPSDNLQDALEAWTGGLSCHEHSDDSVGPWDELASWYWQYWNEINHDLAPYLANDGLPSKPLRDTLICLYFKHVHPLCPIFDEVEFYTSYYLDDDDTGFLKSVSLLELQAMMFAASLHLNNNQIRDTKYQSTYQCHKALFETAKGSYQAYQGGSLIALTRAALLLTYWSPYSTEKCTNNYWVDQAFRHARAAHLHEDHEIPTPSITPGRMRLIWWCCVLRDRLLSFGLRRFQCLHKESSHRSLPTMGDFGMEAQCSSFLDVSRKTLYIRNFIAQCELSISLASILRFVQKRALAVDAAETADPAVLSCTRITGGSVSDIELDQVTMLHLELDNWSKRFEKSLRQQHWNTSIACSMPYQMTNIHYRSAVVMLYLPYSSPTSWPQNMENNSFSDTALRQVRESVSHIAQSIQLLAYNIESNDVPCAIGAWISFPIAVKTILLRNSACLEDPARELREMRSLIDLLCLLKDRFSGGRFISNVLDAVISQTFLARGTEDKLEISRLLQDAGGMVDRSLAYGVIPSAKL